MTIFCDWHIHTPHSCDCQGKRGVPVAGLEEQLAQKNITSFGISDHLHTPYNLVDLFHSHEAYLAAQPGPGFHFGVEVSVISQWELEEIESGRSLAKTYGLREGGPANGPMAIGLSAEDIEEYGVDYVIAGTHWPLYVDQNPAVIISDYHRQNLFAASHPLVDIVAHPWWWMGGWANAEGRYLSDPWLDDFGKIPLSLHDEFAAACLQHGTAVEINMGACLYNPLYPGEFIRQYADYLAYLAERKVTFSIGSDCHGPGYNPELTATDLLLREIGIGSDRLFTLPDRSQPLSEKKKDNWQEKKQQKKILRESQDSGRDD